MRVNVYAEEMTDRIEIIEKETADGIFTGVRFYLELPVTPPTTQAGVYGDPVKGPFIHREGDDDSAAVTFWGKRDLRRTLVHALQLLDSYYSHVGKARTENSKPQDEELTKPSAKHTGVTLNFPARIFCPRCGQRHVETDGYEKRPHTTHLCEHCGAMFDVKARGATDAEAPMR